jgi:protein SCO1/2
MTTSLRSSARRWCLGGTLRWLAPVATLALPLAAVSCQKARQLDNLGQIPTFTFTDQDGRAFGTANLRGKVSVAAFMFTRCPTICPRITAVMRELQVKAQKDGIPVHWVSFSVDPENDTAPVLEAYARERQLDLSTWSFVTGDTAQIRAVAEEGFKIAAEGKAEANADHYGISHGSHLVLVDQQGQIRGYYRTLDDDAQRRLLADAKLLASQ